ncbi:putative 5-hydroxytryptamine receptor 1-like [Apostichopus japonicus]|uniref:Putative 5-hydroxytryptamine receptor 1-like n=1 Tax=Stichopus japonicus TaxID=307972 RepID=A0A2G8JDD0_STIJA|nr:putative 5-hydroxytryptamine receptor 1-like [Apostichopus japonicus]
MRTKTNTFIANLAVADLGVTVLCMPFSLVTLLVGDYKFGMVVCNINAFCDALFLVASIHGLTGISLQKYFALVRPLSRVITRRRIKYMIAMAWLTATVSAIGPLIGWSENTYKPGSSQCGPKYPETIGEYLHGYYNLVVALVIPLLVCLFVYISVFNASRQYSKRLQRNTTFDVERIFKQQIQIVKTIFVIVITFFFCWTPYFIYAAWVLWGDHNNIPFWFNTVAYMSGFANSALNPIIYALRTVSFKRELRKMFGFAKSGSPDSSEIRSQVNSTAHLTNQAFKSLTQRAATGKLKPAYSAESFQFINILIQHDAISVKDQRFLEVYRNSKNATTSAINIHQEVWKDLSSELRQGTSEERLTKKERIFSDGYKDELEKRHFDVEDKLPKLLSYKSCPT